MLPCVSRVRVHVRYIWYVQGHASHVASCSWDASSKWLASGSWDGSVRVWDAASSACNATFKVGARTKNNGVGQPRLGWCCQVREHAGMLAAYLKVTGCMTSEDLQVRFLGRPPR